MICWHIDVDPSNWWELDSVLCIRRLLVTFPELTRRVDAAAGRAGILPLSNLIKDSLEVICRDDPWGRDTGQWRELVLIIQWVRSIYFRS
jgi:hypothetical protein